MYLTGPCESLVSSHHAVTHMCGRSDFTYHKELLLQERICSLWEQMHSYKRSSHFEKGRK